MEKKYLLDIITDSWKIGAVKKEHDIGENKEIVTIIPENHPFRNMLFDYVPKEDIKIWNDEHETKLVNKNFVEFLFTEFSKNEDTRLVEFIVASNASAK